MLNKEHQNKNREWWQGRVGSALRASAEIPTLEESRQRFPSLQRCAHWYIERAFEFFATEYAERADSAADLVIQAAQEALRTEDFERIFVQYKDKDPLADPLFEEDKAFEPSVEQARIQNTAGRMQTLKALHDAIWFRTGERPKELWEKAARLHRDYYDLYVRGVPYPQSLVSLLMDHVEAQRYEDAMSLYQKNQRPMENPWKGWVPSKDRPPKRNVPRVLSLLSAFALGDRSLEQTVRSEVEHQYVKCLLWHAPAEFLKWRDKLGWAYLRGKHLTGVTDIHALIHDLRGY